MPFQLTVHNYSITPDIWQMIEERINKLNLRVRVIGADVYIKRDTHHNKGDVFEVEIAIRVPKKTILAKEKAPDLRAAIRAIEDKLEKQIGRYKNT
ncbi:MAG: ribosome-associated translation inhibitor RaiA [Candidatus Jacksonbacteria bacterium]|nr:ribosome-associated translation inhibitor RaiA [Candidatus Jacksonbacteria bacterium]